MVREIFKNVAQITQNQMENNPVCPHWMGYFLVNPMRKLVNNPNRMLETFIRPGMIVIDYGCAMGYFSIPLAKMVGKQGKVFCFDIQDKMLEKLMRRAMKAGVKEIVVPRLITGKNDLNKMQNQMADFALLFAVAHEVVNKAQLFSFISLKMKTNSLLLFAEPRGHVTAVSFMHSVLLAEKEGFRKVRDLEINQSHAILLEKIK
jgi:2-polyprenyl-3-methyl-5-hydroxy-6-metoxy-1,4-benzoquinol methylase